MHKNAQFEFCFGKFWDGHEVAVVSWKATSNNHVVIGYALFFWRLMSELLIDGENLLKKILASTNQHVIITRSRLKF